jgi:hypothetical protein
MSTREALPARELFAADPSQGADARQAVIQLIRSRDFVVALGLSAVGMLVSLCLALLSPPVEQGVALVGQFS